MKRLLPFTLPVLIFAFASLGWLPAYTGITFVSSTSIINATTSANIDTTGANFIVAAIGNFAGSAAGQAFSDSKGNTWASTANCNAGNAATGIRYVANATVGSGHNFTTTGSGGGFAGIAYIRAYSGVGTTSPLDGQSCTCTASGTGASGSITPANANALLITGTSYNGNYSSGPTASFTDKGHNNANLLANMGGGIGELIQTSASAANPSWTNTSSETCTSVAAFDPPAAVVRVLGHHGGFF